MKKEKEVNSVNEKKSKRKIFKIVGIVVGSIVGFFTVVLVGFHGFFMISCLDYYKHSEKAFLIPDINNNYIAQGLCFDEETNSFFLTGYMNDKTASPIYVIDKSGTAPLKKVLLADKEGNPFKGHSGGISTFNNYVYVAGGESCSLFVYSKEEIMHAKYGDSINCLGEFKGSKSSDDGIGVAFTTIRDGHIYLGEFYRAKDYETNENHHVTTANGTFNQAIMASFELDTSKEFGINNEPVNFYSIPNQVQGCAIDESNRIYFSTSYGLAFSNLLVYDFSSTNSKEMTLLGNKRDVTTFDSDNLLLNYKMPPMSEEIEIVDGKLYTMCESASNKYIFGKLLAAQWCYATRLNEIIK